MGSFNCMKKANEEEEEIKKEEKSKIIQDDEFPHDTAPQYTEDDLNCKIESEKLRQNPNQQIYDQNNQEIEYQNEKVEEKVEKEEEKEKFEEIKVVKIEQKGPNEEEKVEKQEEKVEKKEEEDENREEEEKVERDKKIEEEEKNENNNVQNNIRKTEPLDSLKSKRKKEKVPEDNNVNKSSKIPLRAPNSEELRKMDKEEKKQEKKKRHKQRVNNGKGVKKDKKEEVKDEKDKEGDKNFDEKNPLDALGSTVIKTIYNNQVLNEQTIVLNNNQNAQFTASRQGARDLENMRFLNSTELSKNNSNHQQKFLTNSPPDNMNLINNIPSSASNDKNPYNQDLSNSNAISYRIQNVEIKANIQQNGPMPKDSKNFNLIIIIHLDII